MNYVWGEKRALERGAHVRILIVIIQRISLSRCIMNELSVWMRVCVCRRPRAKKRSNNRRAHGWRRWKSWLNKAFNLNIGNLLFNFSIRDSDQNRHVAMSVVCNGFSCCLLAGMALHIWQANATVVACTTGMLCRILGTRFFKAQF